MDQNALNLELDKVKSQVFLGSNAAFFSTILCGLEFHWDEEVKTAETDGVGLWWNPTWFLKIPKATRKTVLVHEIEHVARLHGPRMGKRNPKLWNDACDYAINRDLKSQRYDFTGTNPLYDSRFDGLAEEEIYTILEQENPPDPDNDLTGDLRPAPPGQEPEILRKQMNTVANAVQQSMAGAKAGSAAGRSKELLEKFLAPKIDWEVELLEFFKELSTWRWTWKRPRRRYAHMDLYLPSRDEEQGALSHLIFFMDVSGSVTRQQMLRFNSEVKYIQEVIRPKKLTLVQFDTVIQSVKEFTLDEPFDAIEIVGRGGTCYECVKALIEKLEPTAAVIFTDLECTPMHKLSTGTPLLWLYSGSGSLPHQPLEGRVIPVGTN